MIFFIVPNKPQKITQRLLSLRKEKYGERGQAAFAKKLDVSASRYNNYERGRLPPVDFLYALHRVFQVNINWFLTGNGDKYLPFVDVPVVGGALHIKEVPAGYEDRLLAVALPLLADDIAAGPPRAVEDYPVEDFVLLQEKYIDHPGDTFVLRVNGDSMEPAIKDGAFVGIDTASRSSVTGRVYAVRTEDGPVVRRLYLDKDTWVFNPDNPSPDNRSFIFARPKKTPIIGTVCFIFLTLQREGEY